MRRRAVLGVAGTGLVALLAGCGSQYDDRLRAERAATETLVELESRRVTGSAARRFLALVVETGGFESTDPVATGLSRPDEFSFAGDPTRFDGAVYDFTREQVGERTVDEYEIALTRQSPDGTTRGETVPFDDLPAVDRRALAPLFETRPASTAGPGTRARTTVESTTDRTTAPDGSAGPRRDRYKLTARYPSDGVEESRLVDGGVTALRINGTRFAVDTETGETHVTVPVYRYGIAERWSVAEFAARVRETYLVRLGTLPEAEASALETAISGSAYELENDGPGRSLVDRLADHDPISRAMEGPIGGTPPFPGPYNVTTWLVGYDGEAYFVALVEKTYDMA